MIGWNEISRSHSDSQPLEKWTFRSREGIGIEFNRLFYMQMRKKGYDLSKVNIDKV